MDSSIINNNSTPILEITTDIRECLVNVINNKVSKEFLDQECLAYSSNLPHEQKDEIGSNETLHDSDKSMPNDKQDGADLFSGSPVSQKVMDYAIVDSTDVYEQFQFFQRPSIIDQINTLKFPTSFSCEQDDCTMAFMTELNLRRHIVLEHFNTELEEDLTSINLVCTKCVHRNMCMFSFTDLHDYLGHYHVHDSKEFNQFIEHIFVDLNKEINFSNFMLLSNNDILSEKYSFVIKKNEMHEMIQMLNRLRIKQGLGI
jgi:hypothetical protein